MDALKRLESQLHRAWDRGQVITFERFGLLQLKPNERDTIPPLLWTWHKCSKTATIHGQEDTPTLKRLSEHLVAGALALLNDGIQKRKRAKKNPVYCAEGPFVSEDSGLATMRLTVGVAVWP